MSAITGTVYVPDNRKEVWEDAEILASSIGLSRSEMVLNLLSKTLDDCEPQLRILKGMRDGQARVSDASPQSEKLVNPKRIPPKRKT